MFLLVAYLLEVMLFSIIPYHEAWNDEIALLFIVINSAVIIVYCSIKMNSVRLRTIVLIAFIFRVILLLIDYYKAFAIVHSGEDSERFMMVATSNYFRGSIQLQDTNYTDFLSYLFFMIGPNRLLVQYSNVILGTAILFVLYKILQELNLSNRIIVSVITFAAFLPDSIILSGILLREAWVQFFVILSVLCYIRCVRHNSIYNFILAIICVLFASYMHSGVIVFALVYVLSYILYDRKKGVIKIDYRLFFKFVFVLLILSPFVQYLDIFTERLNFVGEVDEKELAGMLSTKNEGGSAYLQWINMENLWQALLFSPLKMFYFLFSPVPLDWRRLSDVLAFVMDSTIYLYLFYKILKYNNCKVLNYNKTIWSVLLFALLFTTFVFSFGTANSGTAMRHRNKLYPVILVIYAISLSTVYPKSQMIEYSGLKQKN